MNRLTQQVYILCLRNSALCLCLTLQDPNPLCLEGAISCRLGAACSLVLERLRDEGHSASLQAGPEPELVQV